MPSPTKKSDKVTKGDKIFKKVMSSKKYKKLLDFFKINQDDVLEVEGHNMDNLYSIKRKYNSFRSVLSIKDQTVLVFCSEFLNILYQFYHSDYYTFENIITATALHFDISIAGVLKKKLKTLFNLIDSLIKPYKKVNYEIGIVYSFDNENITIPHSIRIAKINLNMGKYVRLFIKKKQDEI